MPDNTKPLVIKVQPKSIPNGVAGKWNDISKQMPTFTRDIITPDIGGKDGQNAGNIGAIVSGMPSIFARANLFKLALNYISDKNAEVSGLMGFYKSLTDEWRGFIACLALDYANVKAERIYLQYTDKKNISETANIYEPKGAFGNMLFEKKPLWCDQGLPKNEERIPFIDVITYKGIVVGGTSPESFLFTSVAYKIEDREPFVGVQNGKFTDPLTSELSQAQILQLHGYVSHVLAGINKFVAIFQDLTKNIQLNTSNLNANLETWKREIEQYAAAKGYKLEGSSAPPVSVFKKPFSTLFNFSSELYGEEGVLVEDSSQLSNPILFDPRKLLLGKKSEIARVEYGNDAMKNPAFLKKCPIFLLKAEILGMPGTYYYFTLPLSPLGLNVFGKNIAALVGIDENSAIRSRMTAVFDPTIEYDNLKVKLQLFTQEGKEKNIEEVYTAGRNAIRGHDILIWPNFISKQWNRYFMYSEIPHNTSSQSCPFKATPFVGDVNDVFFRILLDEETKEPIYLADQGHISVPDKYKEKIKAKLHVVSDNRVADNQYKYEIYESNQPFKGVRLTNADKESGYAIIRYSSEIEGLPNNDLEITRDLAEANLGIDFGSTNTSVAYFSKRDNRVIDEMKFTNRRVSLFGDDNKDNNVRPAMEDEIFFFQNDTIKSNGIKSILTIHDSKRLVEERGTMNQTMLMGQAVKGGFPCFEKNLPIETVTDNRYRLLYPRSGVAEIVHDMKWSNQDSENAYKKAYLSSLLLHIYAQLFVDNHIPTVLKWSYPSSMGTNLIGKYNQIWASLDEVNPIENGLKLKVLKPSTAIHISTEPTWNTGNDPWGQQSSSQGGWGQNPIPAAGGWGAPQVPQAGGWDQPQTPQAGGWGGQQQAPQGNVGWNNNNSTPKFLELKTETGPIKFNFTQLEEAECLTEACAVANFIANQNTVDNSPNSLTLCFDVGGSTTDISALCCMMGQNGPALAMVKQNSIRFAAQRVAKATKYSPHIKDALIEICDRKKIRIQGLNAEPFKMSSETAPYYFEQILDRLEDQDFPAFYEIIRGKCPEMMSVNIYVTGLIMFYAGQLAFKLIQEIVKSEDKHPAINENWHPQVNVVFAGKGARIFDWFPSIDKTASDGYYTQLFITGFGGMQAAQQYLFGPPVINPTNKQGSNVKYEVSKGLSLPTSMLLVPHNNEAIEILGEEGFVVLNAQGQKVKLPYDNSITPEMMENIGMYFMSSPDPGQPTCPKFMQFAYIYNQVASSIFGLKMSQQDFMNGFQGMNINNYIKTLPEYYAAVESKKKSETDRFDFVAPIIILEGMKFYDDYLLQGIQK